MGFWLYWYLIGFICAVVTTLIADRQLTISDLFICILVGFFGWLMVILVAVMILDKWGHIRIINLRKFRKNRNK